MIINRIMGKNYFKNLNDGKITILEDCEKKVSILMIIISYTY